LAVSIRAAAKTDIGRVRRSNQDTFGVDTDAQLYVVCDGMGGAAGGEIASRISVDAFIAGFRGAGRIEGTSSPGPQRSAHALYRAAMLANSAVLARAAMEPALRGMGSTLVAAHVEANRVQLVNVGDSRAYLIRDGKCEQLTVDHSYLEEQVRLGFMTRSVADASPLQSVITRAVGIPEGFEPDLSQVAIGSGDFILLTSDGLTRHVDNATIARIVSSKDGRRENSLDARCEELIDRAKQGGGSDNITCVLLQVFAD
jgi:serine/threonine protein phosphatase PrpC